MPKEYKSKSARDAQQSNYGSERYWDYLDQHATDLYRLFSGKGDTERAKAMLTRSLAESLVGNDGD